MGLPLRTLPPWYRRLPNGHHLLDMSSSMPHVDYCKPALYLVFRAEAKSGCSISEALLITKISQLILKATVAGIVGCISIATGCIWIPAQLQISHRYIWLNHWWDRVEKSIYLLLDLSLNILFIRMVKTRLVKHGLKKYDKVMRFNEYIIIVSIGMDILLLGTTFLRNTFVYCQFHPVVYIVKLQIEMTMSRLLIKVARSTGINVYNEEKGGITSDSLSGNKTTNHGGVAVQIQTQVFTHAEGPDEYELDRRDVKDQTLQLQEAESVNSSGEIIKVSPV